MKNARTAPEQTVFIDGTKLKGVVSVDGSYSHSPKSINILGQGCVKTIFTDVPQADFSITRNVCFVDKLDPFSTSSLTQLGNKAFAGSLHYGNKVFGFDTGYLTSYSYSATYGDVPQSNVAIKVFGDIGSGINISSYDSSIIYNGSGGALNASGNKFDSQVLPVYPANINLAFRNSGTNRVTEFSVSTDIGYYEVYGINSIVPLQVSPKYPLEVLVNFTVEIDDYAAKRMTEAMLTGASDPFSINVYSFSANDIPVYGFITSGAALSMIALKGGDGTALFLRKAGQSDIKMFEFSSNNTTRLVSEQISAPADDVSSVRLSYITYINGTSGTSPYNIDNNKTRVVQYASVFDSMTAQNGV